MSRNSTDCQSSSQSQMYFRMEPNRSSKSNLNWTTYQSRVLLNQGRKVANLSDRGKVRPNYLHEVSSQFKTDGTWGSASLILFDGTVSQSKTECPTWGSGAVVQHKTFLWLT